MLILLDMDGVCANFYKSWLSLYNKEFNDSLAMKDVLFIDHRPFVKATKEDVHEFFCRPGFWRDLEPIDGCIETTRRLIDAGHQLVIVTYVVNFSPLAHYEKCQWVDKHLPFIGSQNVIATGRKELVAGDILLDDAPHNLEKFPGMSCAFDAPYNKDAVSDFRISSWKEFEELVVTIEDVLRNQI